MHTERYKTLLIPIIRKHLPNAKIILYGSRARNDAHEGSDIDIALDIGKQIKENVMVAIKGDIEESHLPITFDIVDFHAISDIMQKEIIKDGVIWDS